ncbi:hypothetical protein N0V83_009076 [Neocucurbitaria cava]|uniref:Uncharacterized protein n=1 Tax=Neocucurbitaria cava TaxID=798079 RepID=A0A9W8Y0V3_9PLEO|nr:hypothetical protein N0V83_009076 [Neocucurbitaria cava]
MIENKPIGILISPRQPYHQTTPNEPKPSTMDKETEAKNNRQTEATQEDQAPPTYTPTSSSSSPPTYSSLSDSVRSSMDSLLHGDPTETISVPMITRRETTSIHNYNPFSRKSGKVVQSVHVRRMTREQYLKHYAKDAEGKYVGSGTAAPDAALVFVPEKSTEEDLLRQVEEVVRGKQEVRGKGIGKFGMPLDDK